MSRIRDGRVQRLIALIRARSSVSLASACCQWAVSSCSSGRLSTEVVKMVAYEAKQALKPSAGLIGMSSIALQSQLRALRHLVRYSYEYSN